MALKGKIYSIARQHDDLNTNELFQSMIDKSAAQDTIVMDGRNIAAGSIFAEQIHAGAITADKIRADAITADHITAGVITGDKITSGVIRSQDDSMEIDLNNGTINLTKPLVIGSRKVATEEFVETNLADTVNNIKVGGRNYFVVKDLTPKPYPLVGSDHEYTYNLKPNTTYTISTTGTKGASFRVNGESAPFSVTGSKGYRVTTDSTGVLRIGLYSTAGETDQFINGPAKVKLEEGTIKTDWTPAPEDVEKAYTAVAEAKANLAETQAKAHADGKVTAEEKRAIQDAKDKLAEAKRHANTQAGGAETNAKNYAKEQVDDIEVGGKNLFGKHISISISGVASYSRDKEDYTNGFKATGGNNNYTNHVRLENVLSGNGWYTISFEARGNQASAVGYHVSIAGSKSAIFRVTGNNEYDGRISYTVNVTNFSEENNYVEFNLGWSHHFFKDIKIEKGNKATDWTPAPEDVQAEIDARPTFQDFDKTDKVTINGGNIKAGTISSDNNYSWIDLDKGHFSFGNKRLVWNGSEMTVNGKIEVKNIDGDIPKSKLASAVQTEISAGANANTTVSANKTKWDSAEANAKKYADGAIDDIEVGGRNLFVVSNTTKGHESATGITSSSAPHRTMKDLVPINSNKGLVYQLWNPNKTVNASNSNRIAFFDSSGARISPIVLPRLDGSEYQFLKISPPSEAKNIRIGIIAGSVNNFDKDIKVKVEEGNKPTDWTPAPEDVDDKASSAKSTADTAKKTAESAASTANSASSTANSAASTANSASSTASQADAAAKRAESSASSANKTANSANTKAGEAVTTANSATTTANTANKNANAALSRVTIHDTRNHNRTPEWYYQNYSRQIVQEFKFTATMKIGQSIETYGTLITTVPWSDASGGRIKQEFKVGLHIYTRSGSGTNWSAWTDAIGRVEEWTYPNSTLIGGDFIETGTMSANRIKARSITADRIGTGVLTANEIGSNAITAVKIAAGSITADKIVMGTGTPASGNLAAGRTFSGNYTGKVPGDGENTVGSPYASFGSGSRNNSASESGYVQVDLGGTYQIAESRTFWVAGDLRRYYYKIKYSTNGSTWFYAVGNSANNGWTISKDSSASSTGSYEPTIDRFAIPITARYLRIYGNGNTTNTGNHIYEWELYSKVQATISGSEIVTGTLSADKINANTLSAITANLGTVTAGLIKGTRAEFSLSLGQLKTWNPSSIQNTNYSERNLETVIKDGSFTASSDVTHPGIGAAKTIVSGSGISTNWSSGASMIIQGDSLKFASISQGKEHATMTLDVEGIDFSLPIHGEVSSIKGSGANLTMYSNRVVNIEAKQVYNKGQVYINGNEIIDSGSNSTGEWVKFYDGTMISRGYVVKTLTINQAWGNMYFANVGKLDFPIAFTRVPYVQFVNSSANAVFIASTANNVSKTQTGNIDIYRPNIGASAQYSIGYVAIGRWK